MARKVFIGQKTKSRVNTGGAAVGATVAALSTDTHELQGGVQLVADADNTGVVYVGTRSNLTAGTADATDGFPLSAGEALFIPANSESEIHHIADAAAQALHFMSF